MKGKTCLVETRLHLHAERHQAPGSKSEELQAVVMIMAGASGLLTQTVILKILMQWLGETRILIIGEWTSFCMGYDSVKSTELVMLKI